MPSSQARWIGLAVLAAVPIIVWSLAGDGVNAHLPKNGEQIVSRSDTETWANHLAAGGEVEFRDRVDASPPKPTEGDASVKTAGLGKVTPFGKLSDSQKATAVERVGTLTAGALDRYKLLPTNTPKEVVASLDAAMDLLVYEEASPAILNDEAWVFLASDGDDELRRAWRNVPRGWKKLMVNNAAEAKDGKSLHIIVALDPAKHPALQSLLDQKHAASLQVR